VKVHFFHVKADISDYKNITYISVSHYFVVILYLIYSVYNIKKYYSVLCLVHAQFA